MKRKISEDVYFERLRTLSNIDSKKINESKNRTLGTLVDYKRTNGGIAYGIVKENHNYYIKKGGLKKDLDVADFTYINGLANITNYQYNKLSEAEKNMNLLIQSLNEVENIKMNANGGKNIILENDISKEIKQAEDKLSDAETAAETEVDSEISTDSTNNVDSTDDEDNLSIDDINIEDTDEPNETDDNTDSEQKDDGELEDLTNSKEGDDVTDDSEDESNREIEKSLGKLTNTLRKTELTDSQVKSYVNTFLSAFKDKFPDIEIEDRKKMAEKITKVVPDEDIEDLGQNVEDTTTTNINEKDDNKFIKYAESRGYDKDSLSKCNVDEMSSLVSGYANENNEDNDGNKIIALFIKLMPEVLDILKNEYGDDELADKLEPEVNSIEGDESEITSKLNEALGGAIWGGLKSIGKGISDTASSTYNKGREMVTKGVDNVKQSAMDQSRKQDMRIGIKKKNAYLDKVQAKAGELGQLIQQANQYAVKAGQEPINIGSITTVLRNQLSGNKNIDLSRYKSENVDITNTETQPNDNLTFAPDSQSLYENKSNNENKIREYVRKRLDEKINGKKSNINENKKSEKLKKLDSLIDEQLEKYAKENNKVNEIFGFSTREKFSKLNPNDAEGVDNLFKTIFNSELTGQYKGAFVMGYKRTPVEQKYNIIKQYVENGNKGGIAVDKSGVLNYVDKSPLIKGGSLSGRGFNAGY